MSAQVDELQRRAFKAVENMPALNTVVLEVVRRTGDAECSVNEISELISTDPALASRVLRMANSAYYGLSRRVETLSTATALIGIQSLRRTVMTISTFDLMNADLTGYGIERGGLWAHSLGVATAADRLCRLTGYRRKEELKTAALLHDIGKIVLSELIDENADEGQRAAIEMGGEPALNVERAICGMDHAEFSGMIVEGWRFPDRLTELLRYHHRVEAAPRLAKGAAIISAADTLAAGLLRGGEGAVVAFDFDQDALDLLGLDRMSLMENAFELNADILEELAYWTMCAS